MPEHTNLLSNPPKRQGEFIVNASEFLAKSARLEFREHWKLCLTKEANGKLFPRDLDGYDKGKKRREGLFELLEKAGGLDIVNQTRESQTKPIAQEDLNRLKVSAAANAAPFKSVKLVIGVN